MRCQHCNGEGSTPSTELFRGRRVDIRVPCWHCREQGTIDADKSAFEASLPDYLTLSHEASSAGEAPY